MRSIYLFPTLFAVLGGACGPELGDCDSLAAQELVYSRDGRVATKGQAMAHDSCGQAAFCHSAAAQGKKRSGAPHGMNFDMVPVPKGLGKVLELRDLIWQQVLEEQMPPDDYEIGDSDWTFQIERRKNAARLPSIKSEAGKSVLRNWLACGAPVVADTQVPAWAKQPGDSSGPPSWERVYTDVIEPNCTTGACHNDKGAQGAGQLNLSDPCGAFRALLKEKGPCGVRVTPGDEDSTLLDKLTHENPRCGQQMPPGGLGSAALELVREWVKSGATSSSCP